MGCIILLILMLFIAIGGYMNWTIFFLLAVGFACGIMEAGE